MPGLRKEKFKKTAKRVYEIYNPPGWLQIYYPLYYLDKAIKHDELYQPGNQRKVVHFAVPAAIASIVAWILWVNLRFICRDIFIKQKPQDNLASREADGNDDGFPIYSHSPGMKVPDHHLETDPDCGLSQSEVRKRRDMYGPNKLGTSPDYLYLLRLFSTHSVSLPLEVSAVVAIILHDWLDFVVLGGLLGWHIGTSGFSLKQAHDVQESLALDNKTMALVIRESGKGKILAIDLVPGDVVQISKGLTVPADLRVLRVTQELAVDQSSITGESTPIPKYPHDMLYYGTGVVQGDAIGIVTASAPHSFIGRTIALIGGNSLQPGSPKRIKDLPHYMAEYVRVAQAIAAMTCVALLTVLIVGWTVPHHNNFHRFLEFALGTAIVHVATGRETIIQCLRTHAISRLLARKAVAQNGMINVEALAGIDVFISDKTGTLTANKLGMSEPYCINCTPDELLFVASLGVETDDNGDFTNLDPIDQAFANALEAYPLALEKRKKYKIIEFTPFDPATKMITAMVESPNGERLTTVRGAPKAVLEMCKKGNPDFEKTEDDFREAVSKMAHGGYRALSVARKIDSVDAKWELLGAAPLWDPPRDGTAPSIKLAKSLGIDVKMLTGDATVIAQTFGESIGLGDGEPFLAAALREYLDENPQHPEADIVKKASEASVFSEAFPEDKEAIIRFFQGQGLRVAANGDGINDQPALLRADCGIASEGAAEAAQCVSDIVCLAPGLERMIVSAQISRQALQQVRTYLIYRTVTGLHLSIILFASYMLHGNSPADLRWFMVNIHISDVIGMQLSYDDNGRTPFSQKPPRWRVGRVLATTLALTTILTASSYLTALVTPDSEDKNEITLAQQTVFLGASLTDPWLCLLLLTRGRFWTYISHWKSVGVIFVIEIPGRLSYFGWAGEGMMNAGIAIRIWLVGFGILGVLAIFCWFAADSKLVHKQVRLEDETEAKEDSAESETADDAANLRDDETAV